MGIGGFSGLRGEHKDTELFRMTYFPAIEAMTKETLRVS